MDQDLYVIHLGAVVCIVSHSIYNNLIVLRLLVEMCQCLFNVQYLEAGAILDFSKAKVFVGKQFGTSIVSHSMKYRVSF